MEKCELKLKDENESTEDGNKQTDYLSRLCDAIIHHILSFVPVKEAAKTCILAKRWRKLWASIPFLDFDQKCFRRKIGGASRSHPDRALVDFMSGAILSREQAPINLLRMSLDYSSSFYYPVRQWIQISMKLNVHEMYLDFSDKDCFLQHRSLYPSDPLQAYYCDDDERPRWDYDSNTDESDSDNELDSADESDSADEGDLGEESDSLSNTSESSDSDDESESTLIIILPALFNYGSLRVLQLSKCKITHEGPMVFGNLTGLVLRDVDISEKLLHKMLSSCSVLEKLELRKIAGLKRFKFSARKLLSMKLECCHYLKEVLVDAEELQYFKFGLSHTIQLLSVNFPALVKAEIGLCHNINRNKTQRAERLLNLLKDFCHVTDLTLYSGFFKDMTIPREQLKSFTMPTVKRFEIIGKMANDSVPAIFGLLKAFNNLESLSLSIVHPKEPQKFEDQYEEKLLRKSARAPICCLQSHLKDLKINGFEGRRFEINLLEFLVGNCKVLENVDVGTYTPSMLTHGEITARLLSWPSLHDVKMRYR